MPYISSALYATISTYMLAIIERQYISNQCHYTGWFCGDGLRPCNWLERLELCFFPYHANASVLNASYRLQLLLLLPALLSGPVKLLPWLGVSCCSNITNFGRRRQQRWLGLAEYTRTQNDPSPCHVRHGSCLSFDVLNLNDIRVHGHFMCKHSEA